MAQVSQRAFFSYSRDDSEFAIRLAEDLKAAGANVWMDQLDIEPGMPWDRAVEVAVTNCPHMLVILSPTSVNSDNVRDEISFALSKQKKVIPVLYRECDVPFRLARLQHIDFRTDYGRGLKTLLKIFGIEQQSVAARDAEVPGVPGESLTEVSDADERKRAIEETLGQAKRARLEQMKEEQAEGDRLQELEEARQKEAEQEAADRKKPEEKASSSNYDPSYYSPQKIAERAREDAKKTEAELLMPFDVISRANIASPNPRIAQQVPQPPPPPPVSALRSKVTKRVWISAAGFVLLSFLVIRLAPYIYTLSINHFSPVVVPNSHFVGEHGKKKNLLIFVHGVIGDMDNTWVNLGTHASWPQMIEEDRELPNFDVFVYGYASPAMGDASSIERISVRFLQQLRDYGFFDNYDEVSFVTHSMGGIVTKRALNMLNTQADSPLLQKVHTVIYISVPSNGADLATLASWISNNPQFRGMNPKNASDFLQSVEGDWANLLRHRDSSRPFPRTYSAYETVSTGPVQVVPQLYTSELSDGPVVGFDYNHINIVKPKDPDADVYRWVKARLLENLNQSSTIPVEEVARFAPSTFPQSTQKQLKSVLVQYSQFLSNLGLNPRSIPTVHVEDTLPEPGYNSYIIGNDIFVRSDHARPANVLREYSHAVLVEPVNGDLDQQWAYSAIEAGLASYLTADFLKSPVVDETDLDRRFPIRNIPHTWQGGQDKGSVAWGSFLWALRKQLGSKQASSAAVRAWGDVRLTSPPGNYQQAFLDALVSAGLDATTLKTLSHP